MALAKIHYTNKETGKTVRQQRTLKNKSDAEYWLNNFNASHIKIHSKKIIAGKEFLQMELKKARDKAKKGFLR